MLAGSSNQGAFQKFVVFVVISENRFPDPLTILLIPIARLVIPDPGAVIPDPTQFIAWSLIPYTSVRPWNKKKDYYVSEDLNVSQILISTIGTV